MSLNLGETMDLHRIKTYNEEVAEELKDMNTKMDKQIALLEQMVEILKERRTDADY